MFRLIQHYNIRTKILVVVARFKCGKKNKSFIWFGGQTMVDFNSEGTVTTPPADILKILILEKREYVLEAITNYYVVSFRDMSVKDNYIRAGLMALWLELKAMLLNSVFKREKLLINGKEESITIKMLDSIYSKLISAGWLEGFDFINSYLYTKGLIKVDSRTHYDKNRVSAINRQKGL